MKKYTQKDILVLPDPRLREKSNRVREVSPAIRETIRAMREATLDWEARRPHEVATALSAIQIGRPERIIIVREDFEDKNNHNFVALINPKIVKFEGKIEVDEEGCLSVPDIYGKVPRWSKVRVRALDEDGCEVHFKSPNPFVARVLQHEIDHTNGICFVDYITRDTDAFSVLNEKGDLVPVSFAKVQKMGILPDDADNRTLK